MAKQVFINLPVKDLDRSMKFFEGLGFIFNPTFTNEQGACMVVSDTIYVMLLREDFFSTFTQKPVVDATKATEVLVCLDADSRADVDAIVKKAQELGGSIYREPQDHGWMYQHAFADLDGHQWEFAFMDEAALQEQMAAGAADAAS